MFNTEILQTLSLDDLIQQKNRFLFRNQEFAKMNLYLNEEKEQLELNNQTLKIHLEMLIKLNNQYSNNKIDSSSIFSNKINIKKLKKIFSPIKEKIKVSTSNIGDFLDNNKKSMIRGVQKLKSLKENIQGMLKNSNTTNTNNNTNNINASITTKKRIFEENNQGKINIDLGCIITSIKHNEKKEIENVEDLKYEDEKISIPLDITKKTNISEEYNLENKAQIINDDENKENCENEI